MNLKSVIYSVMSEPSKNAKIAILEQHADNELLKRVLRMTYDKSISYYITPPKVAPAVKNVLLSLEEALDELETDFATRKVTGNAARDRLDYLLSHVPGSAADILYMVLNHDLRAGINAKIINKVWPNLIPEFDFLLADTDPSAITYPAISQLKADGLRAAMSFNKDTGKASFVSRNGKPIELCGVFDEEASKLCSRINAVIDGELVCFNDGVWLSRKVSNGIVAKAIKGTITKAEAEMVRFIVWDINDVTQTHTYHDRWMLLSEEIHQHQLDKIQMIETIVVNTYQEALNHFKAKRRQGLEGTIVKNIDGLWVPKRSKDLCKFKAEVEGDFEVVGMEKGTGKNADRVGALLVATSDRKVVSKVGIFKDMDEDVRDTLMTNMPKVVSVVYNERITDKSRKDGTESLFLPRVTQLRWDKDVANTRDDLIKIEAAILAD